MFHIVKNDLSSCYKMFMYEQYKINAIAGSPVLKNLYMDNGSKVNRHLKEKQILWKLKIF